nr:MAG TPA: hypothetical protein [Caudoviricetes sp.]
MDNPQLRCLLGIKFNDFTGDICFSNNDKV